MGIPSLLSTRLYDQSIVSEDLDSNLNPLSIDSPTKTNSPTFGGAAVFKFWVKSIRSKWESQSLLCSGTHSTGAEYGTSALPLSLYQTHLLYAAILHQMHNVQSSAEVFQFQFDGVGAFRCLAFCAVNRLTKCIDHTNLVITFSG